MSEIKCPRCKESKHVALISPDYGTGAGFACYGRYCQRYVFSSDSPTAVAASAAAKAKSAANAAAYALRVAKGGES
jgi:hypothetical protein